MLFFGNVGTLSQDLLVRKGLFAIMSQFLITGSQVRMARAGLRLSVREVAEAANVAPNTVTRVEAGQPVNTSTLTLIRQALEAAGMVFRPDGFVGPSESAVTDRAGTVVDVAADPGARHQKGKS